MGIFNRPGLLYISHRGFRPLAPDNSLPGFEYAGILKQWAIETDVHISADGILVCNHDLTVDATYNGTACLTQGSNPYFLSLLHWQSDSLLLRHLGSPDMMKMILYFCSFPSKNITSI